MPISISDPIKSGRVLRNWKYFSDYKIFLRASSLIREIQTQNCMRGLVKR